MEGRVLTTRTTTVRRRLAALAACSLIATVLPLSALAEPGIPAGSGAVITAGAPLLVRVAPGWDADVSYEIADGSYVTVWDVAQAAPDGSMWYPVDGGFVPVDNVTSAASLDGGFQLYQDAATEDWTEPATEQWTEPAATDAGWVDPNTGEWVDPSAAQTGWVDPNTGEWVDPAASQTGWVDPNTGQWVDPNATLSGWVDPNTGQWVDTNAAPTGWVDPNTGHWVDPATTNAGWVDPNTGQWVDPSTTQSQNGWVDPNTGEWVNGVALAQDAAIDDSGAVPATDDLVAPATDAPVEAASLATDAVDPNTGAPVEAAPDAGGWVDPNTGEWVTAAPADEAPVTDSWTETAPTDATTDAADQEWVEPAPVDTAASGDSYGDPIGTAYIAGTNGDGAACRASAERGSEKLAVLGDGEPIEVRGEAVGEWQPVNCAGMGGYVNTAFVSWEPAAAPSDEGRRSRGRGDGGGGSGSGSEMVQVAMQYVGYPYAYAGEGPYAFDCSGFTKFVAANALGMDITHDMFTQIGMGQSVDQSQLQPGDLVFFANTFRPGLSHVGIYIGNGQFVHAENESTGVVVSDLNSDYYGSRWAGGTRLA
jgi:cell wall-associated NlpC family hydrolase